MKRRLFNAAAVVSLIMCLAFAGLWVLSYWWLDDLRYVKPAATPGQWRIYKVVSFIGGIAIVASESSYSRWEPMHSGLSGGAVDRRFWKGSSRYLYDFSLTRNHFAVRWSVHFPIWVPMALSALLPGAWIWRRTIRRAGVCRSCGYDLRGSPSGGTCPECGAATPARDPASPRA